MEISYTNKLRITWFLLSLTALLAIISLHVSVNKNQSGTTSCNSNENDVYYKEKEINLTLLYRDVQNIKNKNFTNLEHELLTITKQFAELQSSMKSLKEKNISHSQSDKVTEIQHNLNVLKEGFILIML